MVKPVRVQLAEFSPALFPLDPETVLATRADGSVISYDKPAGPERYVILYATGLGATRPEGPAGQIPTGIAWLDKLADFDDVGAEKQWIGQICCMPEPPPGSPVCIRSICVCPKTSDETPSYESGSKKSMSPADARLPVERGNP